MRKLEVQQRKYFVVGLRHKVVNMWLLNTKHIIIAHALTTKRIICWHRTTTKKPEKVPKGTTTDSLHQLDRGTSCKASRCRRTVTSIQVEVCTSNWAVRLQPGPRFGAIFPHRTQLCGIFDVHPASGTHANRKQRRNHQLRQTRYIRPRGFQNAYDRGVTTYNQRLHHQIQAGESGRISQIPRIRTRRHVHIQTSFINQGR